VKVTAEAQVRSWPVYLIFDMGRAALEQALVYVIRVSPVTIFRPLIPFFALILLLSEGRTTEPWEPLNKARSLGNREHWKDIYIRSYLQALCYLLCGDNPAR